MRNLLLAALCLVFAIPLVAAGERPARILLARLRALEDDHYSISKIKHLRQGRYRCVVTGVLCNACTRGIVAELKRIRGVKNAAFDFEDGLLWITIKRGARVRSRKVRRALAHASRRVNLGRQYRIADIRYEP
ncbi:hypothetical protein ACFL2T_06315 [Elusimicrobiota bacterium]